MSYMLGLAPNQETVWALFDLDWTLIRPVKKLFYGTSTEYRWLPGRRETLVRLAQMGYRIGVVTNQKEARINPIEVVQQRLSLFFSELSTIVNSPLVLVSTADDVYRKPNPGWGSILRYSRSSWYCGDAAGRPDDFSDSDRQFAVNLGIPFYLPEQLFPSTDIPGSLYTTVPILLLLVGAPGSGKSTFARLLQQANWTVLESDRYGSSRPRMEKALIQLIAQGVPRIVIDGTNGTQLGRQRYFQLAPQYYKAIVHCIHPGDQRNQARPNPVPAIAINTYWSRFEEPNQLDNVPVYQIL